MQEHPNNPLPADAEFEDPVSKLKGSEEVAPADPGRQERRAWPRFPVDDRATVLVLNEGASVAARIVEVSGGGCRIQVPREFRVGVPERIEVAFRVNGMAFRLGAVTQWSDGRGTLGVGFSAMAQRRRDEVGSLVEELSADAARRAAKELQRLAAAENAAAERLAKEIIPPPERIAEPLPQYDDAQAIKAFLHLVAPPVAPPMAPPKEMREPERAAPAVLPVDTARSESLLQPSAPQPPDGRRPRPLGAPEPERTAQTLTGVQNKQPAPLGAEEPGQSAKTHRGPGRERRQQSRHLVDTHATIYFIDVAARERGRILDVSMTGCRIRTQERFPSGIYRRVETEFKIDGLPFRLAGVVQSMHDRHTVGIRFLNVSERKRSYLLELMEEIEEMRHSGLLDAHEARGGCEQATL